jgi:hypothetical protein
MGLISTFGIVVVYYCSTYHKAVRVGGGIIVASTANCTGRLSWRDAHG